MTCGSQNQTLYTSILYYNSNMLPLFHSVVFPGIELASQAAVLHSYAAKNGITPRKKKKGRNISFSLLYPGLLVPASILPLPLWPTFQDLSWNMEGRKCSKDKQGCSAPFSQRHTNEGKKLGTHSQDKSKSGTTASHRNIDKTAPRRQ